MKTCSNMFVYEMKIKSVCMEFVWMWGNNHARTHIYTCETIIIEEYNLLFLCFGGFFFIVILSDLRVNFMVKVFKEVY